MDKRAKAANTRADALKAQLAAIREALEPFGKLYPHPDEPDHWPAFGKPAGQGWPTVGQFRRARAALDAVCKESLQADAGLEG